MKKTLVFAMAMALGVSATAFAANPFSDLPAGHWAYASVAKLAAAGIVDGYPDGTFKGDRTMTRYEMAQIVAKALAKGAIGADDKLVGEFADELDNLGVRVAKLEKKSDNVKIAGYVRAAYQDVRGGAKSNNGGQLRSRLFFNGDINDNWTYTGMLHNDQALGDDNGNSTTRFQRAFLTGKYGNFTFTGGRYNETLVDGNVYDDRVDGVKMEFGKNVKFTAAYGKMANRDGAFDSQVKTTITEGAYDGYSDAGKYWRLGLDGKLGKNFNLGFDYINADKVWAKSAEYAPDMSLKVFKGMYQAENWKLGADYILGDGHTADQLTGGKNGYVIMLGIGGAKAAKPGSFDFWANYYNQPGASFINNTFNANYSKSNGFKGYGVGIDYTVAKNMIAGLQYFDLKDKNNNNKDFKRRTLWSQLVITF
jgi:hypothetical protein